MSEITSKYEYTPLPQSPEGPAYDRYATLNFEDLATSNLTRAKLYNGAAVAAMAGGVAILAAGIICSAVFSAPVGATVGIAIGGLFLYKYGVHGTIYEYCKGKAEETAENGEINNEYQSIYTQFSRQNPSFSNETKILSARFLYWRIRAEKSHEKIELLDKKKKNLGRIIDIQKNLVGEKNPVRIEMFSNERRLLLQEIVEEEKEFSLEELHAMRKDAISKRIKCFEFVHLAAKINAAYFLHLLVNSEEQFVNPKEQWSCMDFGECRPKALDDIYFTFNPKLNKRGLRKEYIERESIDDLRRRIFTDNKDHPN